MVRGKSKWSANLESPDGKIPVAIYARASSNSQDVENSTEAQVLRAREWAEKNNRIVTRIFIDKARSGRADNRPDFRQMIEEGQDPNCPFVEVILWRFSRFFRDRIESAYYKQMLKKRGIRVVSINEPTDDSPAGRLMEGVIEAIDGFHSEIIGQDVSRGTRNLAGKGFFLGSAGPYGMMKEEVNDGDRTRKKLTPDPKTSPHVRRLFDMGLENKTESQIAKTLNEEGIPGPGGKKWTAKRVHDVLHNRHYEGTIVWGKRSDKEPPVVTPNAHQGIVTPEEFERIQELLRSRAHEVSNPRHSGSQHLLSGLVKCRQCGAPYTYTYQVKNDKIYWYLVCRTRKEEGEEVCDSPRLAKEDFEQRVMDAILNDILTQDNIQLAIEELATDKDSSQNKGMRLLDDADKRLQSVGYRRDRLYLAYENGDIAYEKYAGRNAELKEMEDQISADKDGIMETLDDRVIILENPDVVLAYSKELVQFLRTEEPLRCRPWLTRFIKRIWIEPHWATVQYRIPLPEADRGM
jgi:DNA invertase Pin-like site-specific DNA recombinase